ncbi:hypothetical protein Tco_0683424 [Tanacetum coccineum]|uniref:Uncharacterized protein n=1 Tax=Tanacetum coccineum TaxID=301880 RepID=A0ABQ4XTX7_9ASTR
MITTNSRIGGKKPSGLILPTMGVRLATRERALCKSMLKSKQQGHRGAYLLRDKIAFVRFRISTLETTLEDIQVRHQLHMKDLLKPTS